MKPDPEAVLKLIADKLLGEILPTLPTPYLQANAQMMTRLLANIAEQADGAAAWRAEENAALRRLFERAAPLMKGTLAVELAAAAHETDNELRISALGAKNDRRRALLIDLHVAVESTPGPEARALEADIWAELAHGCERRRFRASAL